MKIRKDRFEDASEPEGNGEYEYWYSGFNYEFELSDIRFSARAYDDEPGTISFLGQQLAGKWERFEEIPYDSLEFRDTVHHLVQHAGIERVHVFVVNRVMSAYVPVDLEVLTR